MISGNAGFAEFVRGRRNVCIIPCLGSSYLARFTALAQNPIPEQKSRANDLYLI